jgi:hypothetical protein
VPGIRYAYYEGEWDSLPSFGAMTPAGEGVLADISFSPRRQEERFAFVYDGYVTVPTDGVYTFYVASDDGSRLSIDGSVVADNDYLHGMQEAHGVVPLGAGPHHLRVEFFEKTGGDDLRVSFEGPGITKRPVPASAYTTERIRP